VTDQSADLDWAGSVPVSRRFDDPYYSLENGLAEARHVFLGGNDLPARFRSGFAVAELGFGTGLNVLAAWHAWREEGIAGALRFTSCEAYPMSGGQMAASLSAFPQFAHLARPMVEAWAAGRRRIALDGLDLEIIEGDARETELWDAALLAEVARHTRSDGTAATYSAAGGVRRALAAAGFTVERRPGFGRKRHMTVARL
jgi:tRNA U34 5-methylaminomethyl-2-thiouridine-forming methyltransferase MnmC